MEFSLGLDLSGALGKTNAASIKCNTATIDVPSVKRVILTSLKLTFAEYDRAIANLRYEMDRADQNTRYGRSLVYQSERSLELELRKRKQLRQRWASLDMDNYLTRMAGIQGLKKIWGEMKPNAPIVLSNRPHLCAQTTTVILDDGVGHKYDMGEYVILIPLGGDAADMHWIPTREPNTIFRHPHHGLDRHGGGRASTCLGSFRSAFEVALEAADAVTLLNLCVRYINSFDPYSQLRHISNCQFARLLQP